ncbi:septal ring lytic transglycosylase RlpA family protein [Dyella tabacisoli]|uniref:Endolytic peptidoglycan transglycosylase RlpA n=1 Tax=Dyella tabacisoli TaxID=2282381 RepID=A0A369UQJ5_9GAMM|nr:septal ring lytic transglycosylase RlpA family protein [Dyella tabacisoli]RDD82727.1 septal ring lytic transglycosylase RlpA family protein [Dyella tabacisoli]
MKWRCVLPLLLALLLLAGCSGSKPRPGKSGGSVWRGSSSGTSRGGVNDDVSRSQSSRYRDNSDSVPGGPPPDLSKLVEPTPKVEPRALYGNKSPYSVLGQSYRVLPNANGYVERGIASFYGNKFHGYKTSSLEDYDMYQFSAAHKTLPLPSYARVTNLENGKSVTVRINDRGPFHENRLIDLSYAAAVKIGIWPKGTGLVEVRAITPGQLLQDPVPPTAPLPSPLPPPLPAAAASVAAVPGPGISVAPGIYLQVGAFTDNANAERVAQQLRDAKFAPVQVVDAQINGRSVRRVRVGPLSDVDRADQVTTQIEGMGLPRPQVAVD